MSAEMSPSDTAKFVAARRACRYVESGMRVGLGTGSTATWMIRCLADLIRTEGLSITGVATSQRTAELAREAGIEVVDLETAKWLDLTIDGADEIDGALDLVKGGGGALLREKIVASASDRMVVIADASKRVDTLGAFPLPVEVVPFGWTATRRLVSQAISALDVGGERVELRMADDAPFVTDGGNFVLDLHLGRIGDAPDVAAALNLVPGVIDTGLFVGLCDAVVVGHGDGRTDVIEAARGRDVEGRAASAAPDNLFADLGE